jgi:exodeoxyribonuclease-3
MRVITANLNGIRSATAKGWFRWMLRQKADIVCVQEIRIHEEGLSIAHRPRNWFSHFCCAEKKGYSGVGIYSRRAPDSLSNKCGVETIDREGRWLRADFGDLSIVSLYVPSGSTGEVRQAVKMKALGELREVLTNLRSSKREAIICGDFNIAHNNIDLENWRGNRKNSGFLPEERAYMDLVFGELGFVDAFRVVNQERGHYTFWSNRGRAWEKNVGWRIDYQIVTPGLKDRVLSAGIYKRRRFADHAPLSIDYRWEL